MKNPKQTIPIKQSPRGNFYTEISIVLEVCASTYNYEV